MQDIKGMYALAVWSWHIKISGVEKNIKTCLALTVAKKYKSPKNNEKNRKRIANNLRKETVYVVIQLLRLPF